MAAYRMTFVVGCSVTSAGLSAVARPETDHSYGSGEGSLLASQRSATDTHRSSDDRLPALPSSQRETLREIDEVRGEYAKRLRPFRVCTSLHSLHQLPTNIPRLLSLFLLRFYCAKWKFITRSVKIRRYVVDHGNLWEMLVPQDPQHNPFTNWWRTGAHTTCSLPCCQIG